MILQPGLHFPTRSKRNSFKVTSKISSISIQLNKMVDMLQGSALIKKINQRKMKTPHSKHRGKINHLNKLMVIFCFFYLTSAAFTLPIEIAEKVTAPHPHLDERENTQATPETGKLTAVETGNYAVGDYAQGGVVFYVDASGKHGKVVYIHQMGHIRWSEVSSTYSYCRAFSPTNGAGNTSAIIQNPDHIISAGSLCAELAYGGYDDWYLPSIQELSDLYDSRTIVDQTLNSIGGEPLGTLAYWSSLESTSNYEMAYAWKFFDGTSALGSKNGFGNTRAIRSF